MTWLECSGRTNGRVRAPRLVGLLVERVVPGRASDRALRHGSGRMLRLVGQWLSAALESSRRVDRNEWMSRALCSEVEVSNMSDRNEWIGIRG